MLKATFYGHSCVFFTDGKHKIIVDPFFTGNPHAPVKAEDIDVDYILATHGHSDHLGDSVEISKRTNATIIAPNELANWVTQKGALAHNMYIGGGYNFEFGRVKLTIAHHGSAAGESGLEYTGNPCGFVFTMGGKTVYNTGDTGLFLDMKLIGELDDIDLMFVPIGDNFTMGVDDAVKAVEFAKPKVAVPVHYNTWDIIQSDPEEFKKKLAGIGMKAEVLMPNESIEM
jgi:L-ascorbate metabolism protein UlaG (beta-lactamase superfamily)